MRKMKENACNNKNQKKNPGFLLSAVSSNSGKTAAACGLMSAFKQEGKRVCACKCGPDYIDPMFHREVLGVDSKNLDLFFSEEDILKEGYLKHTKDADITITEGVMGFYDGMSLDSVKGSSYDVAQTLGLPVILVINARGAAMTLVATVKGIVEFRPDSNIRGILLNRVSAMLYPRLKEMLENELARIGHDEIKIVGYMPENEVFHLESRHLGLVTPQEMENLQEKVRQAGEILTKTVDLELLEKIAGEAAVWKTEVSEEYVADVMKDVSIADVQLIMQNLLKERVAVRDLKTILETISVHAKVNKNHDYLTEQVRQALARNICKQNLADTGELLAITLAPDVETTIAKGVSPDGQNLTLDPDFTRRLLDTLNTELEKAITTTGNQPVILCSSPIRLVFRRLIERTYPQIAIMSYNEITQNVKAKSVGLIRVPVNKR